MAAPSATARQTPTGIQLDDGHPSFLTLSRQPAIKIWEKAIQPPGVDNGSPKDLTSFFNVRIRRKSPRKLIEYTDGSYTGFYDPAVKSVIDGEVGIEQTITIEYADGSTEAAYGYIQKAEYSEMKEGEAPDVKLTLVFTGWDPANDAEALNVITSVPGT